MGHIKASLNLNKTPQLVESNSLVYAKNIKLLKDNTIGRDSGISAIPAINTIISSGEYSIAGVIPYNTKFYVLLYKGTDAPYTNTNIVEYNENTDSITEYHSNWIYNGGVIDGEVVLNLVGDILIIIAESGVPNKEIPLKTINLNKSLNLNDTFYTQNPVIPLANLNLVRKYSKQIPNGVYQFFIRYKIAEDLYTSWMPASKECFAATHKTLSTNQGGLSYVDDSLDSDYSFVLEFENLTSDTTGYISYQIGYIISHDQKQVAKKWREFSFDTTTIYFDCEENATEEITISELFNSPFGIYNVKNLTSFKNKLYISNYTETNYKRTDNDEIDIAKEIEISLAYQLSLDNNNYYGTFKLNAAEDGFFTNLTVDSTTKYFKDAPITILNGQVNYNNYVNNIDTNPTLDEFVGIINSPSEIGIGIQMSRVKPKQIEDEGKYIEETETIVPRYKDGWYINENDSDSFYSDNLQGIYNIFSNNVKGIRENESGATLYYLKEDIRYKNKVSEVVITRYKKVKNSDGTPATDTTEEIGAVYYKYDFHVTIDANESITWGSGYFDLNNPLTTLLPEQEYNFYIHYITHNGEITDGYLINEEPIKVDRDNITPGINLINRPVIYPTFNNIKNPNPTIYNGAFISVVHIKTNYYDLIDLGDVSLKDSAGYEKGYPAFYSLELNSRLINYTTNIPIISHNANNDEPKYITGGYYSSGQAGEVAGAPTVAKGVAVIGNTGIIITEERGEDSAYYSILEPFELNNKDLNVIKATPIFLLPTNRNDTKVFEDNSQLNLGGYVCEVSPLLLWNIYYYVAGTDLYRKQSDLNDIEYLTEITDVYDPTSAPDIIKLYGVSNHLLYSNYNLNFVNITRDYVTQFKTVIGDKEQGQEDRTIPLIIADSLTLSDIYKLNSMYYDYLRPPFVKYDDTVTNKVQFDNTIRSSKSIGDEETAYIYKFLPTEYYNVPTDKGIIINLEAVGTNILVHTQDSLYRFLGYNSLTSSGGEEVQLQESNVFETGINELFGSKYGYAGLADKKDAIVTQNGYEFFDKDAKRIYHFDGQSNLKDISEPINKLFKDYDVDAVRFSNDYYNDRLFVQLIKERTHKALLSFNYRLNNFISLHDFDYSETFSTKVNCYFIKNNNIYKIDNNANTYGALTATNLDTRYPCGISDGNQYAIVDIILNDNYENIKTLDSIRWICGEIKRLIAYNQEDVETATISYKGQAVQMNTNIPDLPDNDIDTLNLLNSLMGEEAIDRGYCGDVLLLYTDSCASGNIALAPQNSTPLTYRSNLYSLFKLDARNRTIPQNLAYEYPRYNLGYWSFNNFRNKISIKDVYNYLTTRANEDSRIKYMSDKRYESDNMSLIYGKYFVARFVFNASRNFKLENVSFNITPTR